MRVTISVVFATALLSGSVAYGQAGAQANATAGGAAPQAGTPGAQGSGNATAGTSTSTHAGKNSASLSNGTAVNAALMQPIDAKKNKPGDEVTAKTTEATKADGRVVIPKGSKLIGHVTEAKARTKGQAESTLGVAFDKAILKNGQQVPLNVTVQAIAATQSVVRGEELSAGGSMVGAGGGRASSGGALGGVKSTAGATTGAVTNTAANVGGVAGGAVDTTGNVASASRGATGGLNTAGNLTSNSRGVFGLEGVNLNSAATSSTGSSLITSSSRNVHLDSGTQLLLVSRGEAGTSGE